MRLLVPYLFPASELWQAATPDLRLPALQKLLARGRLDKREPAGVEGALCAAFGIARQTDWPVAPLTLEADGGQPGADYWLRADPVHLAVMRDRVVIAGTPTLTEHEAHAFAQSIRDHFGDDFAPDPRTPTRWYLRLKTVPDLATVPPSLALGHDAARCAARGRDRSRWHARLTELQMLLHGHPLNAAREVRGAPTVNSLWLWGGGVRPKISATRLSVALSGFDPQALAAAAGARCVASHPGTRADLVVLDTLTDAGRSGDVYGWRDALRQLETTWLAPLVARHRALTLEDPVHGRTLTLNAVAPWKFWVRGTPLGHTRLDR